MWFLPALARVLFVALAVATAWGPGAARAGEPAPPRRVVSLNLCADQLLLALADRGQIASLSPLARDPAMSFLAAGARAVPANSGSGEAILLGGADLVLAGRFGSRARRELLERQGVPVMVLDPWRDLAQGRAQIRALATRLGHAERGERLIASIDAALARARDAAVARRSVLVLYRRGWVPGEASLVGDLLRHMGLETMQAQLGLPQGGVVRLERVVETPPDYVLMNEEDGAAIDNGTALLVHPALRAAVPPERRLVLPNSLTICGGPATPATIDRLADEVRRQVR